jgi:hypothetical protein
MKLPRTLFCALHVLCASGEMDGMVVSLGSAVLASALAGVALGCTDESDPRTWIDRLDNPKRRSDAIHKLTLFYDDGLSRYSELPPDTRAAGDLKSFLDQIVDALSKTYLAGGLDRQTRAALMKRFVARRESFTEPIIVKALKEFEIGGSDEEIQGACAWIEAMAKGWNRPKPSIVDPLSALLSKVRVSQPEKGPLVQSLTAALASITGLQLQRRGGLEHWPVGVLEILRLFRHYHTFARPTVGPLEPCTVAFSAPTGYSMFVTPEDESLTENGKTYSIGCFVNHSCRGSPGVTSTSLGRRVHRYDGWERVSESYSVSMQFKEVRDAMNQDESWYHVWDVYFVCESRQPATVHLSDYRRHQLSLAGDDSKEAKLIANWLATNSRKDVWIKLKVSPSGHVAVAPIKIGGDRSRTNGLAGLMKAIAGWSFPAFDRKSEDDWSMDVRFYM